MGACSEVVGRSEEEGFGVDGDGSVRGLWCRMGNDYGDEVLMTRFRVM